MQWRCAAVSNRTTHTFIRFVMARPNPRRKANGTKKDPADQITVSREREA
jgi:hypothetical protein